MSAADFGMKPIPPGCIRPRRNRWYARGTRKSVYERDNYQCRICGAEEGAHVPNGDGTYRIVGAHLELHHVHAFSKGGCSHPHNLVTLCGGCNQKVGVA